MFFRTLSSEKGFGLVHVLAALIIVTVSVAGLFIATVTAKAKASENYHYRSALLVAAGKMELIKYANRDRVDDPVNIHNISGLLNEVVIDERENIKIKVTVPSPYPYTETQSDIQVAPYVMYDRVKLRVKWTEPQLMFRPKKSRYITLYEDYYRKVNQ